MSRSWLIISLICLLVYGQVEAKKGYGHGDQEWGYVTVRKEAHMFWWLYYVNPPSSQPANFSVYDKPLMIWLQGGPGASSTGYGNFEELGPLDLDGKIRNFTWVNNYNVLFIDNPVGSGFSYVNNKSSYSTTNQQIAADLVECIKGFLVENPKFADVPTYITAESYGGKMAAEFSLLWFKAQRDQKIKSNLKGVALGDSWISPLDSVLSWGRFLLETGMVDREGYVEVEKSVQKIKESVEAKKWTAATNYWASAENIIIKVTDNIDFYNILEKKESTRLTENSQPGIWSKSERDIRLSELMNSKVKAALSINATWGSQSSDVFQFLSEDFMKPATHIVEQLLNETDLEVFVFTGQLDLIVATPGTLVWVENLKWQGSEEWKQAKREAVVVDRIIEGYIKEYKKFKMYWINRSGHMVPRDNPYATSAMLKHLSSMIKSTSM